jgi:hypothetical protein
MIDAARRKIAAGPTTGVDNAIREASRKNSIAERRCETDRFCICGGLADSKWPTNRGQIWICDPCREAGLPAGVSIVPPARRRTAL